MYHKIRGDSKLLLGFPWTINGNPTNDLGSPCILTPNGSKIVADLYDTLHVPNINRNILMKFGM
jgi:hypothetical protein